MSVENFRRSSSSVYSLVPKDDPGNEKSEDPQSPKSKSESDEGSVVVPLRQEISVDLAAMENIDPTKPTLFLDQIRPIDFVLVFETRKEETDGIHAYRAGKRERFLQDAESLGLEFEKTRVIQMSGDSTFFVKMHIPWDTIKDWAEKLHARAPLQESPVQILNWTENIFNFLRIPKFNCMKTAVPSVPKQYYTALFRADRLPHYLFNGEPEKLFSRTQRSYIVREMLETVVYGDAHLGEIGLQRALRENIFQAAFPLHDGILNEDSNNHPPSSELNQRQILRDYWANFRCCFDYQPIGHIRSYFGEQIALYFAWLGMYTTWLIPLALAGLGLCAYGFVSVQTDPIVEHICKSGHLYHMCPVCDNCPYWYIKQACSAKKEGYIFDNVGTCANAFILSLWAILFVESWKRKNAELTHYFDCEELREEEEHPRAEYSRAAPKMRRNVITGVLEPYFPPRFLVSRRIASWIVSISFILIVFLVTFIVILIRTSLEAELTRKYGMERLPRRLAPFVAAAFNLAAILVLEKFYILVAEKLTTWEMYRTQREHEDSLAWKAYWFQFINVFSSMFYIGFVKGKFIGHPGHHNKMANMMLESCDIGGCFTELGIQVIITMGGKQLCTILLDVGYPFFKKRFQDTEVKLESTTELNALFLNQQYKLRPYDGLTEEYLEMAIQFGIIVLFGAAFPLAPALSLVNNILAIRQDAANLVVKCRRPVARRAQSIGIWLNVLQWMTVLSACLIAFTSEVLTHFLYKFNHGTIQGYTNYTLAYYPHPKGEKHGDHCRYEDFRDGSGRFTRLYYQLLVLRLSFVIFYVGSVYAMSILISSLIPDTPKIVLDARKRRRYLANQALQSTPAAAKEAYARARTSTQVNPLAVTRSKSKRPRK